MNDLLKNINRIHTTELGIMRIKKIKIFILLFAFITINAFSQETYEGNYFQRNFNNRIHLGYYSSYFDDNIQLLQCGYDAVLKWFHSSNGKPYDNNPALNTIGMIIGLQFQ
jgi:hypothetical protein